MLPQNFNVRFVRGLEANKALYQTRFERRGWILQNADNKDWFHYWVNLVWLKSSPDERYTLKMERRLTGRYVWSLQETATGIEISLSNFEWVDWDINGRLVGAKMGQILALNPADPMQDEILLQDFNSHQPTTGIIAPEWAKEW